MMKDGSQMSNDIIEYSQAIINATRKFQYEHQARGYDSREVDQFLEWIVKASEYYAKNAGYSAGTQAQADEKAREVIQKSYADMANEIINTINNSRFTQGFKGYDTAQVDEFLDEVITSISDSINGGVPISARDIRNPNFKVGFRGYDVNELDAFMGSLGNAVDRLESIRDKRF